VRLVIAFALCAALAGPGRAFALGNPASAFCATLDGQSILAKLPDGGTIGLCSLPGRKIVEEWTLYRMLHGVKPTPDANPFR
jgi:putative hemolysin